MADPKRKDPEKLKREDKLNSAKSDIYRKNGGTPTQDKDRSTKKGVEREENAVKEPATVGPAPIVKAGKVYKPNQITIFHASQYNTSLLRSPKNTKKYFEDLIAFMTNHVWNYSLNHPDHLVFNYKMPKKLFNNINKNTISFIQESVAFIKKSPAWTLKDSSSKTITLNYLFRERFTKNLVIYLKKSGYTNQSLRPYFTKDDLNDIYTLNYDKLFYFWINQIFAFNVEITTQDEKLIVFNTDKNSYVPLMFASYFLSDQQVTIENSSFMVDYGDAKYSKAGFGYAESYLTALAGQAAQKDYVNTNNYWYASKERASALDVGLVSNYKNSLYNSSSPADFDENYVSKLNMVQKIKKCSKVKDNKKETSLRLFYKEGNDDVLVDDIPKGGLGCQTDLLEWKKAKQALYNIQSLQKGRLNAGIPYYSMLRASIKNLIPDSLDILKTIPKAELPDLKTFNTLVILNYLKQTVTSSNIDLLIDKSLTPFIIESVDTHAEFNYWAFIGKSGTNGGWGPDDFLKSIIDSSDTSKFLNLSPYLGLYNVGYVLEKYDSADNLIQEFYINPVETKGTPKKGFQDAFTYLDSQIKYGKEYSYRLRQLVAIPSLSYNYKAKSGASGLNSGIGTQKTDDGKYTFLLPNNFSTKFENKIIKPNLTSGAVKNSVSYIDLPPQPTYMDIYPKRSMNDRVTIIFNEYASSLSPDVKRIPKKEWLEGWQKAKEAYVNQVPQNPPLKDEDMPFMSSDVDKILLYRLEGIKPTRESDFTEIIDELNVLFDGYSKEVILKPNTKYYFATRSVSYTGLSSCLSEIYSVELVDDGGAVFPLVEIVQLEKEVTEGKKKLEFTSRFRIEPALLQQAPNTAKNRIGYLDPITFSTNEETRPRFKIRLTSKKTGRKADFNVIYKRIIHEKSTDAGSITLSQTKKDKVLISYKGEYDLNPDLAAAAKQAAAAEKAAAAAAAAAAMATKNAIAAAAAAAAAKATPMQKCYIKHGTTQKQYGIAKAAKDWSLIPGGEAAKDKIVDCLVKVMMS